MEIGGDRIECITFDLDDTLWLCEPVILNAEWAFYTWLQQNFPRVSDTHDAPGLTTHRRSFFGNFPDMGHDFSWMRMRWLEQLADDHGYERSDFVEPGFEVFLQARNDVTLFQGAHDVLQSVRSRYKSGTITNGNADVRRIGIDHYFDFNITASGAGASKPHPVIFQAAVDAAGVEPKNILHIGDDPERDVRGAARIGMKTLWVNPQGARWKGRDKPDAEIRIINQLTELLNL